MVQEVALLNTQGGFLSVDRPNPFMKRVAKTGDDSWEKFKIIGLERTDDCTFKVGIQTRDGDYLSATPSNVNSTGYHLLEYKGQLLEWETFTAEVDDHGRVAFKTHMGTYIAVRGNDKWFGKGWVCHRTADDSRLHTQCKFLITTPHWAQKAKYVGVLHGKNELWKTLFVPVRITLVVLSAGFLGGVDVGAVADAAAAGADAAAAGTDAAASGTDAAASGIDAAAGVSGAADGPNIAGRPITFEGFNVLKGLIAGGIQVVSWGGGVLMDDGAGGDRVPPGLICFGKGALRELLSPPR